MNQDQSSLEACRSVSWQRNWDSLCGCSHPKRWLQFLDVGWKKVIDVPRPSKYRSKSGKSPDIIW